MAKKETTAKKAETKKKAATKKPTTKKATPKKKIEIVKEEQKVLGPVQPTEEEFNAAVEESIKNIIEQAEESEPIIVGVNGDPSVIAPVEEVVPIEKEEPIEFDVVEEKVEKKVVEEKDEKKKITKRNNQSFGYFWNGQMIDF